MINMGFSGLLMYGAAQKNRFIGLSFFAALCIYLYSGSQSLSFFAVNITVILLLSLVLRRVNSQILSGASILVYSVIIDIVCFYFFPIFPVNAPLGAYIASGLMFNLRSALPAVILGFAVQILIIARFAVLSRQKVTAKKISRNTCLLADICV